MSQFASDRFYESCRMSDASWRSLVDELDRTATRKSGVTPIDGRRHERVPYRNMPRFAVLVQQPGGNWSGYIVRSRNLSESGVGFFHGSFLHDDARCVVLLRHADGKQQIPGRVRRCQHLRGMLYDIGVEFDETVDPARFLTAEPPNRKAG